MYAICKKEFTDCKKTSHPKFLHLQKIIAVHEQPYEYSEIVVIWKLRFDSVLMQQAFR